MTEVVGPLRRLLRLIAWMALAFGVFGWGFLAVDAMAASSADESKTCLECHDQMGKDIHLTPAKDGGAGLGCTDCHTAISQEISEHEGLSVASTATAPVDCSSCHSDQPHGDTQLDLHTGRVGCTVCHIPAASAGCSLGYRFCQVGDATASGKKASAGLRSPQAKILPYEFKGSGAASATSPHGVAPKDQALACTDCHQSTRLNFKALGYATKSSYAARSLCGSCHERYTGSFTGVHEIHVQQGRFDCSTCHNFCASPETVKLVTKGAGA